MLTRQIKTLSRPLRKPLFRGFNRNFIPSSKFLNQRALSTNLLPNDDDNYSGNVSKDRSKTNEHFQLKKEKTGFENFCKYYNGIGFGIGGMYLGGLIPAYFMSYSAVSFGLISDDINNFFGLLSLIGPVCMVTMPTGIYFGWKYGKDRSGYAIPFSTLAYLCLLSS
jgi:hypothetical protein